MNDSIHVPQGCISVFQVLKVSCEETIRYFLVPTKYTGSLFFRTIYFGISLLLRNISPIFITCVATGILVHFIQQRKRIRKISLSEGTSTQQAQLREDQLEDLTVCLILLAVSFAIFVFPISFLSFLLYINITNCTIHIAFRWAVPFALLNNSVNFIIYYWKLPLFRKSTNALLRCCGGKELRSPENEQHAP